MGGQDSCPEEKLHRQLVPPLRHLDGVSRHPTSTVQGMRYSLLFSLSTLSIVVEDVDSRPFVPIEDFEF